MTPHIRSRTSDRELEQVIASCTAAHEFDQYICLLEFYDVLAGLPQSRLTGISLPCCSRFEAMLEAECWESAVLATISDLSGIMLSSGQDGAIASVILPGQVVETTKPGRTLALALCAAIASAFRSQTARSF